MKGLREKFRKNEGFTLVEMLIVVAIIAILIAVSIPMVSSALEKSRHAVDQANVRDAIALASIEYLTNEDVSKSDTPKEYIYVVDATTHQGTLESTGTGVSAQCTCTGKPTEGLKVKINKDGKVATNWKIDDTNGNTTTNSSYDTFN